MTSPARSTSCSAHEAVTSIEVGVVGFCMGGGFVVVLAAQQGDRIGAAVPFYGVAQGAFRTLAASPPRCRATSARTTAFTTRMPHAALAERIKAEAGVPAPEFFFYPAGHAFFNDENLLGTYDPEQADLAWQRAVEFLRAHVS